MTFKARTLYSLPSSIHCWALECLVAVAVALTIIAPRGASFWLGLSVGTILAYRIQFSETWSSRKALQKHLFQRRFASPAALAFIGLGCFSAISAVWSGQPMASLIAASSWAILFLIAVMGAVAFEELTEAELWYVQRGMAHGLVIGLAYLTIEFTTSGTFKSFALDHLGLEISGQSVTMTDNQRATMLNRHSAVLSIIIWPALHATNGWLAGMQWRRAVLLGLAAWAGALAIVSESETAKVAFCLGALTYISACWFPARTIKWLAVIFAFGALLTPLIVLKLMPVKASYVAALQFSARDRVVIWNHTMQRANERPLLGTGANMTPILDQYDETLRGPPRRLQGRLSRHAHNFFVQTWFELGVVGAFLLALTGTLSALALAGLSRSEQPYGAALFVSVTCVMAAGYGMWQVWLLAAGMSILMLFRSTSVGSQGGEVDQMSVRSVAQLLAVLAAIGLVSLTTGVGANPSTDASRVQPSAP
jgi:hypothetical protein